jgi:uncharacterized membrane protein YkoI
MLTRIRKPAATVVALGALGVGGATIADAATKSGSTAPQTQTQTRQSRHQDDALSSDVAAEVKAAALDKVPGATVLRTEAGGPYSTAYHAHVRTSDGTEKVVLVNGSFEATAVEDRPAGRGRDRDENHGGGARGDETALTGDTRQKVEDAVLANYSGATIVRTETNGDGSAPYESHIRTSDGKEVEVLVNGDFQVVGANERPAHP